MKGQQIFNETVKTLFGEELLDDARNDRPGRDAELIALRNEQIMYRYYYYVAFQDKRWDKVLGLLNEEFRLSEVTLGKIIQENSELRRQIMLAKPTLAEIRKKYTLARWD